MTARTGGALPSGGTSGLRFYYLQVERYSDGLNLMGLPYGEDTDGGSPPFFIRHTYGLNGNTLAGMEFHDIGTKWTHSSAAGYGAVVLTNSSHNTITNSHFLHIESTGDQAPLIHGVYLTHFSSYNVVSHSRFSYVSGTPTKVRDRSTLNSVEYNTFERAGDGAYYRDDVCDHACFVQYDARAEECSGYHNRFIDNTLTSGYDGEQNARVYLLWPWKPTVAEENVYAGDPGRCALPSGENRLQTWGNK